MLTFKYLDLTGLTQEEILRRAKIGLKETEKRFGKGIVTLQNEIDAYIDAAVEYAQ